MRILHLSDLHFGTWPRKTREGHADDETSQVSKHAFVRGDMPDPAMLAGILKRDTACTGPDAIIVSGDLGWSGVEEDYRYCDDFFRHLRQGAWSATPLIVIPGNHDVDRRAAAISADPQEAFTSMLQRLYGEEFDLHYPLYATTSAGTDRRQRLIPITHLQGHLLVVGVNSAARLTTGGTPVYVDTEALQAIEEHIAKLDVSARTLRLFVVHHHLLPFAEPPWRDSLAAGRVPDEPDPTIVANSAKLQGWLSANGFHVVLHGHKHLSHSREDTLWRRGDPAEGRRLLVVGAGSVGVAADHRVHAEPLTYNVLDFTRSAESRWDVRVATRRISDDLAIPNAGDWYTFRHQIGSLAHDRPPAAVFNAERMDDCHAAIQGAATPNRPIRNFVSVVDNHEFVFPDATIRLGDRTPTEAEVWSSFQALHPEYRRPYRWNTAARVDRVLRDLPSRFQFQHGPRLFGAFGRAGTRFRGLRDQGALQPMRRAVESLDSSNSRAYVGLYNADTDLTSGREPLPGLMSVQLVPDGEYLDAVATFRKLELSFWWVVNMLEIGELLRWAASQDPKRRTARRITFFAALAEWKPNPEPTFVTELDALPLGDLNALVLQVDSGQETARRELIRLLRDKAERTNEVNIDEAGIQRLAELVRGLVTARSKKVQERASSPFNSQLQQLLEKTVQETQRAIDGGDGRNDALVELQDSVMRLIEELDRPR